MATVSGANGYQMVDGRPTHWISIFPNKPWCCALSSAMKQTVMHKLWCGKTGFKFTKYYHISSFNGTCKFGAIIFILFHKVFRFFLIRTLATAGSNVLTAKAHRSWISVYRARKAVERAHLLKGSDEIEVANIIQWLRKRKTSCSVSNDWLSFLSKKESWIKRFRVSYFS